MYRRTFLGASLTSIPLTLSSNISSDNNESPQELEDKNGSSYSAQFPNFKIIEEHYLVEEKIRYPHKLLKRTVMAELDKAPPKTANNKVSYTLWYPIILDRKDGGIVPNHLSEKKDLR